MTVLNMSELDLLLSSMACYLQLIKHQKKTQGIALVFSEAALCGLGEAEKPGICPKEIPS